MAHAYQTFLAELAVKESLPVSKKTREGELTKFADDDFVKAEDVTPPKDEGDMRRFEVDVMLKDVVADVGGFLYAGSRPVRRSSRISIGYMIPVLQGDEVPAQLEAQFHVRYAVTSPKEKQAIYNVEIASALYTLSFLLDDENVAVPSSPGQKVKREEELEGQSEKRREVALKALYNILSGDFGGKRSRFLPSAELKSAVVVRTDFPFVPEPGTATTT